MVTCPAYVQGSDLPDLTITWRDSSNAIIDFSSGYTFSLKVGQPGLSATVTKSTGISGASTSPNVTISWSTSGELNTLTPGTYIAQLIASRTSDSKQRFFQFVLPVNAAIT